MKTETATLTVLQRQTAKLAVAAAVNGTSLYSESYLANPECLRTVLLAEVEDWFRLSPTTAAQFDHDTTVEYVRAESLTDLVQTLDEMGHNPFSQIISPCISHAGRAVSLWEDYVRRQAEHVAAIAAAAE